MSDESNMSYDPLDHVSFPDPIRSEDGAPPCDDTMVGEAPVFDFSNVMRSDRRLNKRGSILTYTNKTLKQHWEEYIGTEDPIQVLSEIYTPQLVIEKDGHMLCTPPQLPKKRVCLNKIRTREMNRQRTLILIRTKGSRRTVFLEHFLRQSIVLPFSSEKILKTVTDQSTTDSGKPDVFSDVKNAITYCCIRVFLCLLCVTEDAYQEGNDEHD